MVLDRSIYHQLKMWCVQNRESVCFPEEQIHMKTWFSKLLTSGGVFQHWINLLQLPREKKKLFLHFDLLQYTIDRVYELYYITVRWPMYHTYDNVYISINTFLIKFRKVTFYNFIESIKVSYSCISYMFSDIQGNTHLIASECSFYRIIHIKLYIGTDFFVRYHRWLEMADG